MSILNKENLLRIDSVLKPLDKEALKELLKGKWQQKFWLIIWILIFFAMALVIFPILLILNEEGITIPIPVIFLPFTLWWIGLMIVILCFFLISRKIKQRVQNIIWKYDEFKAIPLIRGRKFVHPALWPYFHYLSKALIFICIFIVFSYLGIFVKSTISNDISFIGTFIISWVPIWLIITFKQIYEMTKSLKQRKFNSQFVTPVLKNAVDDSLCGKIDFQMLKSSEEDIQDDPKASPPNPREIKFLERRKWCWRRNKVYYMSYGEKFNIYPDSWIDFGLIGSIIWSNLFFGGFFVLWALRLDGIISLNWFIITIPTWLFIIPVAILTILHGITSQNKSVTLFEKITFSILVPIGFTATYILILLRLEGYISLRFLILFIPNFVSVFSFYVYTRQLKTVKIAPKPEESKIRENNANEIAAAPLIENH